MEELIRTEDLSFEYQGEDKSTPVLHEINLKIHRGEFVAVLGHNGSGKSTLAKQFNSILIPTGGVVYVEGIDTSNEETIFDVRQRVGMVFQNPDNQIVATLVEEDVAFAPENLGVPPEEIRQRVDSALQEVDMYDYRNHAPHQLSGGQKQRVAIAGIIAMQPDCIVLDEATAMLDPRGRREVLKTIESLNRDLGTTIVHITHFMEEAVLAGRVVVIDNGRILLDGTPAEVFRHVEQLKEVGLDVPQVTELMHELRAEGIPVSPDVLTARECVDVLVNLLEG
ncbi:cobalt ABC transporter, ATP-binding protein [[Clostridium] methylpentosum DSM 5476]|uniref:Cobalt ABC transporter, ATP-binding protein n=1 Tax=[Clostridium] methylpentosum DSM 5476 TaxID=537013 RepID=C0EG87_9FIRM|nr:cobalt ABC transporter, ATP-binding protein [[Clostridium] methylpentosum DSM 5476]